MKHICLLVSILALVLTVSGCGDDQAELQREKEQVELYRVRNRPEAALGFLSGSVVKIYGNLPGLVSSSIEVTGENVRGGGETVKLGEPIFGLHVQTPQGLYIIQFSGEKVYALESIIQRGTKVRFPTEYHFSGCDDNRKLFDSNLISCTDRVDFAYLIEILPGKATLPAEQK